MNILFVHQNFPGQFRHVAPYLAQQGHQVVALGQADAGALPGVRMLRYRLARGNAADVHPLAREFETKVLRAEACAEAATSLKSQGFTPDVIFSHPGWGEAMYLKAVFPRARMACLMEFYYRARGQDMGFDPEFPMPGWRDEARLQAKNANLLLAMEAMDLGIAATPWQKQVLPEWARDKTVVLHEGIDTDEVAPDPSAEVFLPNRNVRVRPGDEVLTYVARNLEPVRGYHVFMRALPRILRLRPQARVFIVGGDGVSYGAAPQGKTYRQQYLEEVGHQLDPARVHFMGKVPRNVFLRLMQVTRCHAYLTYPFVLSWSMLEAMSAGAVVVGSDTAPVRDVIRHGENGLLADFYDAEGLADAVADVLGRPQRYAQLGRAARQTVVEGYDLNRVCLPGYESLLHQLV